MFFYINNHSSLIRVATSATTTSITHASHAACRTSAANIHHPFHHVRAASFPFCRVSHAIGDILCQSRWLAAIMPSSNKYTSHLKKSIFVRHTKQNKDLHAGGLFCALALGQFSMENGFDEAKNRFKFAFRGMLTLPWTLRWLESFCQQPVLLDYLRQSPRLACKLHRPYLYRSLGTAGKVDILTAHYSCVARNFSPAVRDILLSSAKLPLATLEGKDGAAFTLTLTHNHSFDKEGELSLQLQDQQNITLAKLTFTICQQNGETVVIVGGLQGPRKQHGHECIRTATKACHGLFPKRLALEALIEIAGHIGCQKVLAVCKDEHIYSSWRYRRDFQADYDSFWESIGAEKINAQFFQTPFPIPRKAMEEIASKKRGEYNRRYALLDSLSAQIRQQLLGD